MEQNFETLAYSMPLTPTTNTVIFVALVALWVIHTVYLDRHGAGDVRSIWPEITAVMFTLMTVLYFMLSIPDEELDPGVKAAFHAGYEEVHGRAFEPRATTGISRANIGDLQYQLSQKID